MRNYSPKRTILGFTLLFLLLFPGFASAAVRGKQVMYVGGTLALKERVMGVLDLSGSSDLVFRTETSQVFLTIPYAGVQKLQYGLTSKRRIRSGKAAAGSAALAGGFGIFSAPVVVPLLLTKKKNHYVSIFFVDGAGKAQVSVFEIGKNYVRTTLQALEARAGKTVTYETEVATGY